MKYDVILIDPPWEFKVWDEETGNDRSPSKHYKTMSLEDIGKLPILDLAAPNCALFLWSVWPRIFDAERLVEMWNAPAKRKKDRFTYRSLAWEWVKLVGGWPDTIYKIVSDFSHLWPIYANPNLLLRILHFGTGYYMRANVEPCLLFVRGSMPVAVHDERNVIFSPIGEHSAKPAEQYAKIERIYPNTRRLELFARHKQPGWDAFGNALDGIDIHTALKMHIAYNT